MYSFLANMLAKFSYLEYSLIAILNFVVFKMMSYDYVEIPEWVSFAFITLSLLNSNYSFLTNKQKRRYRKVSKASFIQDSFLFIEAHFYYVLNAYPKRMRYIVIFIKKRKSHDFLFFMN